MKIPTSIQRRANKWLKCFEVDVWSDGWYTLRYRSANPRHGITKMHYLHLTSMFRYIAFEAAWNACRSMKTMEAIDLERKLGADVFNEKAWAKFDKRWNTIQDALQRQLMLEMELT